MTETEEILLYDAMVSIQKNAGKIMALANADGTSAARKAYKEGIYAPCIKIQMLLGHEAIERGKARHDKAATELASYRKSGVRPRPSGRGYKPYLEK